MWTYKGINVYRADANASGIRWYSRINWDDYPPILRADSKAGMRALINDVLSAHGLKSLNRR